jgi:hypothetical protein
MEIMLVQRYDFKLVLPAAMRVLLTIQMVYLSGDGILE